MSRRRSDMDADLEGIYNQIPEVGCKGLCWTSCGPIAMSGRERQRIRQLGVKIPHFREALHGPPGYYCPALTVDKKCSVYEVRPAICRLYGATEHLRCPYGCVPDGGYLKPETAWKLLREATLAGGDEDGQFLNTDPDKIASKGFLKAAARDAERGIANELKRGMGVVPMTFAPSNAKESK